MSVRIILSFSAFSDLPAMGVLSQRDARFAANYERQPSQVLLCTQKTDHPVILLSSVAALVPAWEFP